MPRPAVRRLRVWDWAEASRFFESEIVPLLALIVARYRVEVADDPKWAGVADMEEKRERVLRASQQVTIWCVLRESRTKRSRA